MTGPLLTEAAARLAAAGVPSPRVDAELLLADALDVPRSRLVLAGPPGPEARAAFERALARRATREPLQHIVGTAAFRHVEVAVGPGVFVPRPETELLVDAALPALLAAPEPLAVDLCAGSGALALAIAGEAPAARVVAVERDPAALAWLTRNTAGTRVRVVAADVADSSLLPDLRGQVVAVVCNPPYVPTGAAVAAEVRHDPEIAVFGGADGLALVAPVLARAAQLLRPGGVLALEHDDTHAAAISARLESAGHWTSVTAHRDLAGRPRYIVAIRR
ncbi:MAG TPA: peptide chain release factor N(5)-glutamine methyltransferase [Jatrophihabitans sp.]|nr:peptide chain release factor N(5)-glutamine methyltransferase [Jatrophihabitans sp.]